MNAASVEKAALAGNLLVHEPSKRIYKPLSLGMTKDNGKWVKGLTYQLFNGQGTWTRPLTDFKNFKERD
ncbi:MAG: hypothetical protein JKY54_10850 [Flavobacteriales bacterium]|nr:hypothetical protein [Flavobacteriales bacterium]